MLMKMDFCGCVSGLEFENNSCFYCYGFKLNTKMNYFHDLSFRKQEVQKKLPNSEMIGLLIFLFKENKTSHQRDT